MRFLLAAKLMTLDDLEQTILRDFADFGRTNS